VHIITCCGYRPILPLLLLLLLMLLLHPPELLCSLQQLGTLLLNQLPSFVRRRRQLFLNLLLYCILLHRLQTFWSSNVGAKSIVITSIHAKSIVITKSVLFFASFAKSVLFFASFAKPISLVLVLTAQVTASTTSHVTTLVSSISIITACACASCAVSGPAYYDTSCIIIRLLA
jgi:hypothetical protein